MRHVFGTFPESTYRSGAPLPRRSRVTFKRWGTQTSGYFDLIAPFFDEMAARQSPVALGSINALFVLAKPELIEARALTNAMLQQFAGSDARWSYHQGSVKAPGEAERQINVILYRRRLLSIVTWLDGVFARAIAKDHCVVFGNGVCFRMLCGIKLPLGTKEYS